MIIHLGSQLQINFGILDQGNIMQKIPFQVEILDFSDESMKKLQAAFNELKSQVEQDLAKNQKALEQANN